MDTNLYRDMLIQSGSSPLLQNAFSYFPLKLSRSTERILKDVEKMKNSPHGEMKSPLKSFPVSLRYLKLAPISSFSDSKSERLSNRRKFHLRGILPQVIFKNLVARCAFCSEKGISNSHPKPNNQDSVLLVPQINSIEYQFLIGVFDGHGRNGHLISNHIKQEITSQVHRCPPTPYIDDIEKFFGLCIDQSIQSLNLINDEYSGSTLCLALVSGDLLACANIGDSRCVLGRYKSQVWESVDVTRDHKPSNAEEAERIRSHGGIIKPLMDKANEGPLRVWINDDDQKYGIAMTRSIGDAKAKRFGVCSDFDFFNLKLEKHDKFIIIASDGIWDVISSQEAVDIVKEGFLACKSELACKNLLQVAQNRWKTTGDDIDDITVAIAFFKDYYK